MHITLDQLRSHLTQRLNPIYLVQGDDSLLVQDACRAIRHTAKQAGFVERLQFNVDASFQWEKLNEQLLNLSLFADKQLVELRCEAHPNTAIAQGLKAYAMEPSSDKLLLIVCSKLTTAQLQSAWVQAIAQQGTVVTVWPLSPKQLPQWIMQRAKQLNIHLAPDSLELLCEYCAGNLLAARQLLEKLRLLAPSTTVSLSMVQQLLSDNAKYSIFDLVDACLLGDAALSLRIAAKLQAENTEPVLVLWALAREWRELASLSEAASNTSINRVLSQRRIKQKKSTVYSQVLSQTNTHFWYELLAQGAKLDEIIKGAAAGNAWDGLTSLCLQFASRVTLSCPYLVESSR